MYCHMISFAFLLTLQFLTSVSGDHKRVIVYIPHKIRINHHKRTVTKQTGDGGGGGDDYNVIGFSGGAELGNKFAAESIPNQGLSESYGGGHGRDWLEASALQGSASYHGGRNVESGGFGAGYTEVDSFAGGFGHEAGLADNYFGGQAGFEPGYRYR